jgi:predicted RNA-binding Zn ribbon-like protein
LAAKEHRRFGFLGGRLCLDFANTVDWRGDARPVELLGRYADLISWSREAGLLDGDAEKRLLAAARRSPELAALALAGCVSFRESLYRVVKLYRDAREPSLGDLERVSEVVAACARSSRLRCAGAGDDDEPRRMEWVWAAPTGALDGMLWPVARSAAELLASPELERVRVCADARCGWLFLDASRGRRRKWCSMLHCGNRAKARRFFARRRGAAGKTSTP